MRKKQLLPGIAVILCMSVLAGCSTGSQENNGTSYQKVPITDDAGSNEKADGNGKADSKEKSDSTNGSDADSLISNSELQGHVVTFSDTGCTISPQKTEKVEGGELASGAAPGYESQENNVNIHYGSNCQFQFAKISIATGKVDLSDADRSDIKKLTSLIIYGERSDDHNIEAEKVYLVRYE